jgi:preprotein translocase SecE subunit
MRDKVEEAKAEAQKPSRRPKINRPKMVRLPSNRVTSGLAKVLRPVGRVLKLLAPRYFINAWREVRLVTWPGRRETWRLTLAVFIFAIVFGALVAGVDKVLDIVFKHLVLK